jgi:glutathione S-transferase
MTLVLHYAPVACSLVPYVALTKAGAPFEVRAIDFSKGKHLTAEFLHPNPKHKVPVLNIDGEPLYSSATSQNAQIGGGPPGYFTKLRS